MASAGLAESVPPAAAAAVEEVAVDSASGVTGEVSPARGTGRTTGERPAMTCGGPLAVAAGSAAAPIAIKTVGMPSPAVEVETAAPPGAIAMAPAAGRKRAAAAAAAVPAAALGGRHAAARWTSEGGSSGIVEVGTSEDTCIAPA